MRTLLVGVVFTALMVAGCAKTHPQPAAAVVDEPRGEVIVRLVGQHQTVTVTSSPDGPLYTAESADGNVIVANATLAELRRDHPEIYEFVEPSIAASADIRHDSARSPRGVRDTSTPRSFRGSTGSDNFVPDARR